MKKLLLAMAMVLAAACGDEPKNNNNNNGNGLKVGEICDQLMDRYCEELDRCDALAVSVSECHDTLMGSCCEDAGLCDEETDFSQGDVDDCDNDLQDESCQNLTDENVPFPNSCQAFL